MDRASARRWATGLTLGAVAEALTPLALAALVTLFVTGGRVVLSGVLFGALVVVLVGSGLVSRAARRLRENAQGIAPDPATRGRTAAWHGTLLLAELLAVWLLVAVPGVADIARVLVLALLVAGLLPALALAVRDARRRGWGGAARTALQWLAASVALVHLGAVVPVSREVWNSAALLGTVAALVVVVCAALAGLVGMIRRRATV